MKAYWLGGRSSPANGVSTAGADGHNADNSDGGGLAAKGHGSGHHRSSRRSGRKQVERTLSSNRSSPEQSPERPRNLKPLSSLTSATSTSPSIHVNAPVDESVSHGHRGVHGHHHGHAPSKKRTLSPNPPSTRPRTGTSTSMHYLGSNESSSSMRSDSDGDASSSEDSATDLLDAALGLSRTPSNNDQQHSDVDVPGSVLAPGRREMLIQRPVVDSTSTNIVNSFENAMKSMRPSFSAGSGQPRARSATPSAAPVAATTASKVLNGISEALNGPQSLSPPVDHKVFNLASRRRGSPLQSDAKHSDQARSSSKPPNLKRTSTPVIPSGSTKPTKWRLHFRFDILPEVTILTVSLIIAAYKLSHLPEAMGKLYEPIPISPVVMLIFLVPALTLFRPRGVQSNYLFPFTDERGYRSPASVDDGFAAGTVVPVLLAAGFLWDAVVSGPDKYKTLSGIRPLMDVWQARGYLPLQHSTVTHAEMFATVLKARVSLLLTTSMNSFILILHIILSKTVLPVEKVPMNNSKRLALATLLSASVSSTLWGLLALNHAFAWASPYVSPLEAAVSSFIYQMSMYSISRLVRRGFTLGELSLATGAGISLGLEFWRVTYTRFFYRKYGGIAPTFRMPTPLLPYHHVMIPGAFLTGFCLAPLLVLSRHFAQMPSHRLKTPGSRTRNRTLVALGIFALMLLIVVIPFGGWAGWALGGRFTTAWTWGLTFLFFGGDGISDGFEQAQSTIWRYRRVALSLYWLAIMTTAVGGWQTRLVRARRIRLAKGRHLTTAQNTSGSSAENGATISKANLEVVGISNIRENRRMHVALDLRRKFFHALAVLMFVPAIAIDPAFTSLAFAAAFAIFTFAEYARYFAVFPIGAPIHVFFNEFIDAKDAGPVILSHFYLLTGCAGGLWLEGSGIKQFTGVLAVGIGDACASVLGKRIGVLRWPGSSKTLFGTSAFITSIFASALLLRSVGMVEPFTASRYLIVTILAGLLEAMSAQNDNLVIPIFFWSMLSLFEV